MMMMRRSIMMMIKTRMMKMMMVMAMKTICMPCNIAQIYFQFLYSLV